MLIINDYFKVIFIAQYDIMENYSPGDGEIFISNDRRFIIKPLRSVREISDNILNFRTRLSESIYVFFNKQWRYFAMQVATLPRKLAVVP